MRSIVTLIALAVLPMGLSAQSSSQTTFGWGSTEVQYAQDVKPAGLSTKSPFAYAAWKGERVNAEAVLWAEQPLSLVSVSASELRSGKNVIPACAVEPKFIGYVMGDVLAEEYGQCGSRIKSEWDSVKVADIIGVSDIINVKKGNAQPVWVSVNVPRDAAAGTYKGTISLRAQELKAPLTLSYTIQVVDRVLSEAHEWPFFLDLWQNPYAVARYHNVPLWSEAHFKFMRPVMEKLASAGQKVITTTILNRPWNGQTEDPFGPMVTKILRADGTWMYDYTIFDKWVEYMMSIGIDKQINCYSMIPWHLQFDYFDQASNTYTYIKAEPDSKEYENYWGHFIVDFAKHLRAKGWFDITYIAMDERPAKAMRAALDVIHHYEPEFKVALAGNYHEGVADEIADLCITFRSEYPEGIVAKRREAGMISLYYTCCAEKYPNTFTVSAPAEASWIPWCAMAKDVDGYLRWAFNSWTADPMFDARFRTWAAGDCYMIYPDGRPGVHLEKLIEGVQDYEKARILREEWKAKGDVKSLKALEDALSLFTYEQITENGPSPALKQARTVINKK